MNLLRSGAFLILFSGVCVFTTLRISKAGHKILRFLPSLFCLLGAVVCFAIDTFLWDNLSYSAEYSVVSLGISFGIAFAAGLLCVIIAFLRGLLPKDKTR